MSGFLRYEKAVRDATLIYGMVHPLSVLLSCADDYAEVAKLADALA